MAWPGHHGEMGGRMAWLGHHGEMGGRMAWLGHHGEMGVRMVWPEHNGKMAFRMPCLGHNGEMGFEVLRPGLLLAVFETREAQALDSMIHRAFPQNPLGFLCFVYVFVVYKAQRQ
jgi:hypothetical protein